MNTARLQRRSAATLVELIAGLSITAVLMGGLLSAVTLASRAIPSPEDPLADAMEASHAAEQIAADLYCARLFSKTTATAVEFSVADRGTISYSWAGTPGDPLAWRYGGDPEVELVPDVHEFNVTYGVETVSETTIVDGTVESDEIALAYFDGWGGVTPTLQTYLLGSNTWVSEYFEVTPPADAEALRFTRARVMLSHIGTPPSAGVNVSMHHALGDGSRIPNGDTIGTPGNIPGGALTTTPFWAEVTFSPNVTVTDLTQTAYCLQVHVGDPAPSPFYPAYLSYYYAKTAPDDGLYMRWTDDGGGSWDPRSNQINQQDLRFYLWGRYKTGGTQEVTVDRFYLKRVRLALQVGNNAAARIETAVPILNAPEVTP